MSTNFPTTLDQYAAVPTNQALVVRHQDRHQNIEDAMEAVQAKVGIDGSLDPNSLDYRVAQIEGLGAGLAFVSVLLFGAKGDGVHNDTPNLITAFEWASARNRRIWIPAGTYRLNSTVLFSMLGDLAVDCEPGAVLQAASGFAVDTKLIQPNVAAGASRFAWTGGTLDGRNMPARVSGAPDLLYLSSPFLSPVEVKDVEFLCNDTRSGTAGDSCLFLAEGSDYEVTGCKFQGATDSGIYISGNAAETAGRRAKVADNTFIECGVGIISKRGFEDHTITGNIMNGVNSGIVIGGIGDVGTTGRKATITGNVIRRCGRGIESRVADGTVIVGNRIEDFGMDAAGNPVADHAIRISGSKRCVVSGNALVYTGAIVPNAATTGVLIERRTELSVDYDSTNNLVAGNGIHGCARGIAETTGSDNNMLMNNQMTALTGARITLVGANTVYSDMDTVNSRNHIRFGASGAVPVAGANVVYENDGDLFINLLAPSANGISLLFGDPGSSSIGRISYSHASDIISMRAGGSGDVFQVASNGPRFGTYVATPGAITGYIEIRDIGGTIRRLAVTT